MRNEACPLTWRIVADIRKRTLPTQASLQRAAFVGLAAIGIWQCIVGSGQAIAGIIVPTKAGTIFQFVGGPRFYQNGEVIASHPGITTTEWRGLAEFDLTTLSPVPNSSIVLNLPDKGGSSIIMGTTDIYYYVGDGVGSVADFNRLDNFLIQITRLHLGPTTHHDVTAAVNSIALGGHQYIGFLFVAVQGQDDFGSNPTLTFSDTGAPPPAVPEPSSFVLVSLGLANLCVGAWRRRRHEASAPRFKTSVTESGA